MVDCFEVVVLFVVEDLLIVVIVVVFVGFGLELFGFVDEFVWENLVVFLMFVV